MGRFCLLLLLLAGSLVLVTALAPPFWQLEGSRDDPGIDLFSLRDFADRSLRVYELPEAIRARFGEGTEVNDFARAEIRVALLRDPDGGRTLAVRGTDNLRNALYDLDLITRKDREVEIPVHEGFHQAAEEILPWVRERIDRQRPVRLCGHSLGGAVAALLLAILHHEGYRVERAVTFGQPKITDATGVKILSGLPLLRVVHDRDPIPLVPPSGVGDPSLRAYRHFGVEIVLRDDGEFWALDESRAERPEIVDLWDQLGRVHPADHHMDLYMKVLETAIARHGAGASLSGLRRE